MPRRQSKFLFACARLTRETTNRNPKTDSTLRFRPLEMFGDLTETDRFPRGAVSEWVQDFETGKNLAPDPDAKQASGYRVLKVSAVTRGMFMPEESKPLPLSYDPPAAHFVRIGDLLFSRANTADLIGATAYVDVSAKNLVLPDKIWRFVWRRAAAPNPHFIHALFSTTAFRRELTKRATGTSGSMKNIAKEKVLQIEVGLPDRNKQDDFALAQDRVRSSRNLVSLQAQLLEDQFHSLQSLAFSGQL